MKNNALLKGETLKQIADRYNKLNLSKFEVSNALKEIDALLNGYGIESIYNDDGYWVDKYWQTIIAEYVNQGDTYDITILYDVEAGEFLATSCGGWLEQWEQDNEREAR